MALLPGIICKGSGLHQRKDFPIDMTRKSSALGGKIQIRRKRLGWSQEELAQRLGVSRQSVAKWETGQSVPDLKRLVVLADLLRANLDYLLRDEMPQEEPSDHGVFSAECVSMATDSASGDGRPGEEKKECIVLTESAGSPESADSEGSKHNRENADKHFAIIAACTPVEHCCDAGSCAPQKTVTDSIVSCYHNSSSYGKMLYRMAVWPGMILFFIGAAGVLTLWILSEVYPVQFIDTYGRQHDGMWRFILVHDLRKLFWAACGFMAAGTGIAAATWKVLYTLEDHPLLFSTSRKALQRQLAGIFGVILSGLGLLGLLALWVLSEVYPVQLVRVNGGVHTGLWGFVLAHELRNILWAACGSAVIGLLFIVTWIYLRRKN